MNDKVKNNQVINNVLADDYENFGQLLKKLRKVSNVTAAKFSELADVHINSQSNYENNKRDPSVDYLIQFSGFLDISFWQLMARRVELSQCEEEHKRKILEEIEPFYHYLQGINPKVGSSDDNSTQIANACFELLAECKSNSNIVTLKQNGNSMTPTINENDTLFIDSSIKSLSEGDIFVFKFADVYSAKRVQLVPGGGIMLVSDNSNFHPINLSDDSINQQMIVGKLVSTISHFNR